MKFRDFLNVVSCNVHMVVYCGGKDVVYGDCDFFRRNFSDCNLEREVISVSCFIDSGKSYIMVII